MVKNVVRRWDWAAELDAIEVQADMASLVWPLTRQHPNPLGVTRAAIHKAVFQCHLDVLAGRPTSLVASDEVVGMAAPVLAPRVAFNWRH
ncbi:hypothetical protein Mvan_1459 [Mycolicibacterium vanbaalenii PYR-1]|uniref:Uncharacterized protein n=1 Tax=Mycolicibacterium vanbaalenii (strain DSM 7251 / JCM 13017 / BCRC 16820 / KCTC 9966 / NRRL B-24157 / PYR-1) TaxID=350058 RepID=A1T542_MYCVP|nr:hypothetical protein Mvan_1459 [Mycolicibacterium vanbaalenii PYR-1]